MSTLLALEIVAAACGLTCVYLQTKEKILAWPFGIVSVLLYVIIFYESFLYSDVLLHAIYIILNAYGWWYWSKKKDDAVDVPIINLSKTHYFIWGIVILIGTLGLGTFMGEKLGASLPYFDAFTTSGSLVAQYLLAKKVLQNWLLWIVVDVVAVSMYSYKGLYVTSLLFFAYLLLCIKGYIDWKKVRTKNQLVKV